MKRSTLPALSAVVLAAVAAAPAAAQAPPPPAASVTLDRTCYAPGDPITETARGFTPGAEVLETLALLPTGGGSATLSARDLVIPQWAGGRADPARSMTIDTFGWTVAGKTLYAHYYRGTTRICTVRIGALTGPCGDLRRTVRQFPFARVKAGEWRIFFSTTAVLNKRNDDWLRRTVIIPRAKATA